MFNILKALIWQQYDPVSFLQSMQSYHRKLWWPAWILRGVVFGGIVLVLGLVALLNRGRCGILVFCALLPTLILQMLCGIIIMIVYYPQFWLLYAYSPVMLALASCCGLIHLSASWAWFAQSIVLPLSMGLLISDAFPVWVHKRVQENQRELQRMRSWGPVSDLLALTLWRRICFVKLLTSLLIGIVGYLYFQNIVFVLSFLTGYLHLGITLFSWLFRPSLVQLDQDGKNVRVTYVGRTAFVVPLKLVQAIFNTTRSISAQSSALLALFQQGCLGLMVVRRACRALQSSYLHRLILELSLQEGGAAVITYLNPALPEALQPLGTLYAILAAEASKPVDLHGWIAVLSYLPKNSDVLLTDFKINPIQTLSHTRDALLAFTYSPSMMDTARESLRQLIYDCHNLHVPAEIQGQGSLQLTSLPHTWPVALLVHLERHSQRLLTAESEHNEFA